MFGVLVLRERRLDAVRMFAVLVLWDWWLETGLSVWVHFRLGK